MKKHKMFRMCNSCLGKGVLNINKDDIDRTDVEKTLNLLMCRVCNGCGGDEVEFSISNEYLMSFNPKHDFFNKKYTRRKNRYIGNRYMKKEYEVCVFGFGSDSVDTNPFIGRLSLGDNFIWVYIYCYLSDGVIYNPTIECIGDAEKNTLSKKY